MDEAEAIRRVLSGEHELYEVLIRRYQVPVVRLARNMVGDHHEAEDVAQDVFLAAYRHLGRYDPGRASFSTWLFTIARRRCLKALRRKQPRPSNVLDAAADANEPHRAASEEELFGQLDAALAKLPVAQKTAFVLVELVGMSPKQAAEIENVRHGTLRSRLSRAKAALRQALKEFAGDTR
jgi:RNA polymerase sigma-70 factor (ECF subfamily)